MTWVEQRMTALENKMRSLREIVETLNVTELVLSGTGDPNGVVSAVQGTHYWDITNQNEYVNISTVGTPPEGTVWTLITTVATNPNCDCWIFSAVAGVAQTLIPNGANDMTEGGTFTYHVYAITGADTTGGTVILDNNTSVVLYDDGTDQLTLACAADGSVTVQRTAGADTFNIVLMGVWH